MHKANTFFRYILVLLILLSGLTSAYAGSIRVGAYNIKSYGTTKASRPFVIEQIVKIVSRYDLVLIQEIRNRDEKAVYTLKEKLEASTGNSYSVIISKPLGRSTYKEQYAYLYKDETVSLISHYTYDDGIEPFEDTFSREPFIARFKEKESGKTFTTVGAHLAPDFVVNEMEELDNVYKDVQKRYNTQEIIFMGDFNADCHYLDEYEEENLKLKNEKFTWHIDRDQNTTTIETNNCSYDRIITTGSISKNVFEAGPFNIMNEYGFNVDEANSISDHFPVEVLIKF